LFCSVHGFSARFRRPPDATAEGIGSHRIGGRGKVRPGAR
jgi:hypothetical protein